MQRSTAHPHKVLLVGSGLMTPPLIDYLMSFNDTHLTVASNMLKEAQALCKKYPSHMDATELDVFNVSLNVILTYTGRGCRFPCQELQLGD